MTKRKDDRPICNCGAYKFPHRVGGKCDGSAFTEHYFLYDRQLCRDCNSNRGGYCEVSEGIEDIHLAECYRDAERFSPGQHLPLG